MHTAPATLLLVLVPYLTGAEFFDIKVLTLSLYLVLAHYFSFGENSLHDYIGGWDQSDPSKAHHPLCTGVLKVEDAIGVVHWGLCLLMVAGVILTLSWSPNPVWALICLIMWYVWGSSYNLGLSKVSIWGFVPISLCFVFAGGWGWSLSHVSIDTLGILYLGYVFLTILFQISYSGFIKELEIGERSNILTRMGAKIVPPPFAKTVPPPFEAGVKVFKPGGAWIYGWFVKVSNLFLGGLLLLSTYRPVTLVDRVIPVASYVFFTLMALHYLVKLTKPRKYERNKELGFMSLEEVSTIYIPLFVLLPPLEAAILGAIGILYFFLINKILWRVPYPAV